MSLHIWAPQSLTPSLDTKLNRRIGKVATMLARLTKHVWANRKLTEHTKVQVYMTYVVSTFFYGSKTWTLCFDLLKLRCLHWLGHVTRMDDERTNGELASGKRPTGHPQLRFKDTYKLDLKALNINTNTWQAVATDRSTCSHQVQTGLQWFQCELMQQAEGKSLQRKAQPPVDRPASVFICPCYSRNCHFHIWCYSESRHCPQPDIFVIIGCLLDVRVYRSNMLVSELFQLLF